MAKKKQKKPAAKAAKKSKSAAKPTLNPDQLAQAKKAEAEKKLALAIQIDDKAIAKQEAERDRIQGELNGVKEELSEMRHEREEKVEELIRITAGGHPELLFTKQIVGEPPALQQDTSPKKGKKNAATEAAKPAATKAADAPLFPPNPDEAKKLQQELDDRFDNQKLDEIGVKGKLKELLESDGIRNGKALRKWLQSHPRTPIKGIGEEKVNQLNDLWLAWLTAAKKDAQASAAPAADQDPHAQQYEGMLMTEALNLVKVDGKLLIRVVPRRDRTLFYEFAIDLGKGVGDTSGWRGEHEPENMLVAIEEAFAATREKIDELVKANAGNKTVETTALSLKEAIDVAEFEEKWVKQDDESKTTE